MATAGDLINRSLRTAGILAAGETADANMANDALVTLNDVLAGLSNEGLMFYSTSTDTLTLDGSSFYTFGEDGLPDLDSVRPQKILSICYRDADNLDYPVDVVTRDEFTAIGDKNVASDIVEWVYVNYTYPNALLYVYPVSSAGSLVICSNKPFTAFAGLTTAVSFPPGYERMLRYALANELLIEYGMANPAVTVQYMDAKADIKRTNLRPDVLRVSLPFGGRARSRKLESDGI